LFELGDLFLSGLEFCPAAGDLGLQLQLTSLVFLILAGGLALFGAQAAGICTILRLELGWCAVCQSRKQSLCT
jgi:hypothetical protein